MKKTKIISLILALVMIFSLGITAFAAGETSTSNIDIKFKPTPGRQYYFYRVLDAEIVDEDAGKVIYKINDTFRDFFLGNDAPGKKAGFVTTSPTPDAVPAIFYNKSGEPSNYYLKVTETNKEAFAAALKKFVSDNPGIAATKSVKKSDPDVTTVSLNPGYYLITSDEGAAVMTTTNYKNNGEVIVDKNVPPSVRKSVAVLGSDNNPVDNNYADFVYVEYGETVRFKITVDIGDKGAENYVIHDEFDRFKFDKDTGKVVEEGQFEYLKYELYYVDINNPENEVKMTASTQYKLETEYAEDGKTFKGYKWTILDDTIYSKASKFVLYLDMAPQGFVPAKGYQNTTYVTYGSGNHQTIEDDAWVYGAGIRVLKTGETENGPRLNGAEFVVMDSTKTKYAKFDVPTNGTTGTLTWVDNEKEATVYVTTGDSDLTENVTQEGKVEILGLRYGNTYYLKEIKAPEGYNLLADLQKVELTVGNYKDDPDYKYEGNEGFVRPKTVVNMVKGTLLPESGSIGTTMFYVLGSLMAVSALVILVANKRARN